VRKLSLRIIDDSEVRLSISLHVFVNYTRSKTGSVLDYFHLYFRLTTSESSHLAIPRRIFCYEEVRWHRRGAGSSAVAKVR
jgi:hypothetical protein